MLSDRALTQGTEHTDGSLSRAMCPVFSPAQSFTQSLPCVFFLTLVTVTTNAVMEQL